MRQKSTNHAVKEGALAVNEGGEATYTFSEGKKATYAIKEGTLAVIEGGEATLAVNEGGLAKYTLTPPPNPLY